MIQGLDVNHRMVLLEAGKDYDLYVYMYTSMMPPDRMPEAGRFQASLVWVDTEIEALYYDLKVPLDASQYVAHEGREYWQILKALDGAVRLLDLRGLDRESFRAGITAAREYLWTEFYEKVCGGAAPVVHCVGHTHIDVAWLWSLAQTREKAQRSFATVLRLMEQYPEYIFMSSQPQLYQYVKESAPEIYEQIKQRVREGRWEVEGAMWLEAAKFEVCAHKWADLSENGFGVSLLNDCKYGHSADGSTLTLSLLKSATYPDPEADQGHHVFTYSLLPHAGSFRESGTIQESYCLNQPLMAVPLSGNGAGLPETFSLVHCDQPNMILETVKQAEDGMDLILRFYEAYDRRVRARLTLGIPFASVEVCDLMENPVSDAEITVNGQEITLPVRNFEIVTVRIHQ